MSAFTQDHEENWWFKTIGKGNKEREIAVSDMVLAALVRWREHLDCTPADPTLKCNKCYFDLSPITCLGVL